MKQLKILILALAICKAGICQNSTIDSLHNILKKEKTDTGRVYALYDLSYRYQVYKPDSALLIAQQAYDLSIKIGFLKGESTALDGMAGAFLRMGDNSQALAYYLKRLKIEENRASAYNIASINMNIANVYNRDKDTAKAIYYILKADSIIDANGYDELKLYALLNTGNIFEKADRLNEALNYTQQCYNLAIINNDSIMIGTSLNNLGNIYAKLGENRKAITNYRMSKPYLEAGNDFQTISEGFLGTAKTYEKLNMPDSALVLAKWAYDLSYKNSILKNALAASVFLAQLYKNQNNLDSAFAYQNTMIWLQDSIQGIEKIKQLQVLSIQEQIRQQQLAAQQEREKEENRQRLQLLGIGILIPIFFFTSIYISKKKVSKKVIQFSGILSLLMLFEYITLFIHPFVAEKTHHNPAFEIIIFVCIAALMVPAHHKIEKWFTKHLATIHEKHAYKPPPAPIIEGTQMQTNQQQSEIASISDVEIPNQDENVTVNEEEDAPKT